MKIKRSSTRGILIPRKISVYSKIQIGFLIGILFCLLTQCNLKIFDHKKNNDQELAIMLLLLAYMDPGEQYSGGYTTTFDTTVNAFDLAASNLREGGNIEFQGGNSFFNRTSYNFV